MLPAEDPEGRKKSDDQEGEVHGFIDNGTRKCGVVFGFFFAVVGFFKIMYICIFKLLRFSSCVEKSEIVMLSSWAASKLPDSQNGIF